MEKNSFLLYTEYAEHLALLDDAQAGRLFKAILAHEAGEEVNISGLEAMAFSFIRQDLDRNREKYEEIANARSEAGKKGAAKRWQTGAKPMANDGKDSKAIASDSNGMANDSKNADNDNVNDNDIRKENSPTESKRKDAMRFSAPSLDEVREYCKERGNAVDPEAFIDFYTAKGWKVGSQPMKDWRAAVRTWERRGTQAPPGNAKPKGTFYAFPEREHSKESDLDLERRLLQR